VRGISVREVPPFAAHWSRGFTWKPWIWTHAAAGELVFWLDAGASVLRSLDPAVRQIRERGYFVVSQGGALHEIVPTDYYELYGLDRDRANGPYVAGGIVGFRVGSEFYDKVVGPTYEDCLDGRSLGGSAPDVSSDEPLRDCLNFRHDQTVFNLRIATAYPDAYVNDLWRWGGFRSPHDHPHQVIWNHRRGGSLKYLPRVPYQRGVALRGRLFGYAYRMRWWKRMHDHLFRHTTYVLKTRKLARELRQGLRRSAPT